ncbi:lipopolysaccharide transport periplasmic protein LptA [Ferrimonas marina]|uniref:Lipopolysaccharide export system protein LptA n=1 Tax=Ferrimonas marina TaxID=299255 RepID=A0A1M5Y1N4_9GAMM|nr:lipopolysaccharide transport periplasmic protein LptA [Ferrimonas marina]SHI05957.1 lipopolysaccharide export system protein LptA [Ferrimonas marina]
MKCNKLLIAASLLLMPLAQATEADFLQPVKVTADHTQGDYNSRTLEYIDNVLIVQGSLRIEADKLVLVSTEDKRQQVMVATGSPATYQQMMENGLMAKAQANEIRYDINTQELVMTGDAELSQEDSVVRAERIVYNAALQRLSAEGSEQQQITTIFMPADLPDNAGKEGDEQPESGSEQEEQPQP